MIFPATRDFVIEDSSKYQAIKVLEESAELVEAIKEKPDDDQLEEAMDVLQALANLCRVKRWSYSQLLRAYQDVERKNINRGRYKE